MPRPSDVKHQIDQIVLFLVENGLSNDQQFCFQRTTGSNTEITFPGGEHVSIALRDVHYTEMYDHMARERAFNFKLMDGAMIQMMYSFSGTALERHRLAFLPSPHLEDFQTNPEIYIEDEIYADIISKTVVPFPLRFDYDSRDNYCRELEHPKSHLTLGQYENCRIPVSAPLTPAHFVQFILRNFYHTAHQRYADSLPSFDHSFDETILISERLVIHIQTPMRTPDTVVLSN